MFSNENLPGREREGTLRQPGGGSTCGRKPAGVSRCGWAHAPSRPGAHTSGGGSKIAAILSL
eukprot:2739660-Prymnesium_polylepis.1